MCSKSQTARALSCILRTAIAFISISIAAYFARPVNACYLGFIEAVNHICQRIFICKCTAVVINVDVIKSRKQVEFEPFLEATFSVTNLGSITTCAKSCCCPSASYYFVYFGGSSRQNINRVLNTGFWGYNERIQIVALCDYMSH